MSKTFIFSLLLCFSATFVFAQKGDRYYQGTTAKSSVEFKELKYDFGEMPLNANVQHSFEFKNISKEEIHIREVTSSCGCTTPFYSNSPVKPRRRGKITAKYDSSHTGHFKKSLSVLLSDNETIELIIEGEIVTQKK